MTIDRKVSAQQLTNILLRLVRQVQCFTSHSVSCITTAPSYRDYRKLNVETDHISALSHQVTIIHNYPMCVYVSVFNIDTSINAIQLSYPIHSHHPVGITAIHICLEGCTPSIYCTVRKYRLCDHRRFCMIICIREYNQYIFYIFNYH